MWEYKATVRRVVDGDTLDLQIDLGFSVFLNIRARLVGIDTPETYGVKKDSKEYLAGRRATEYVEAWLRGGFTAGPYEDVVVRTQKQTTGKYGRWLVEVLNQHGECLNETLAHEGLASPYP
jgi:micrococcal nuclease